MHPALKHILFKGVGGTDGLPTGSLLGAWYADQYVATPRPQIKNSVSSAAATSNLLSAPRHLFNNTNFYSKGGTITVTDNAVAAPDGLTEASTVVWGSVDAYIQHSATFPAGTYTLAVDVKTTDASTVDFRMGPNASMTTKTATPNWASYSVTFTLASSSNPSMHIVRSLNASTPANLAIANARLFSGAVDLGAETLAGHMVFGNNWVDNQPTVSAGVLTLNASGKYGVIQLPAATALTDWTAIVVSKRKATSGTQEQGFLSKIQNYQQFTAEHTGSTTIPNIQYGGSAITVTGNPAGGWQWKNDDWHVITNRYSGSVATVFGEKSPLYTATAAGRTATIQDLWVGVLSSIGIWAKYDLHAIALYSRALSDAEVATATQYLITRAASSGLTVTNNRIMISEGDSITFGTNASNGSYAALFVPNSSPQIDGLIHARASATLSGNAGNSLDGRKALIDAIAAGKNGKQLGLSVLIGRNDLLGYSGGATQYAADLGTYLLARKAAGVDKIALCTVLPSTAGSGTFNTQRNLLNAIITGPGWAAANGVDVIIDFAADATMGPDAAASDTSLYGDGTHPTNLGQATLEPVYRSAINAMW